MSGRKNVLTKYQLFVDADMSGDLVSEPTNVQFLDNLSISLLFPAVSAAGQFFIEISNDGNAWQALDILPGMFANDPDGQIFIEITQLSASMIRVRYASDTNPGVLNAFIEGKAI